MPAAERSTLERLHNLLTEEFITLLESGAAKSADLNAARQFLRDNGIQDISDDSKVWHLKDHSSKVPFPTPEEVAEEAM